jgi:lipopolysaccharide/colanic/teichoic acid biosynthesis glycosyltransferase
MATSLLENPAQYQTRVGRVIRKLSIDELPQLWCVLIGDMSFIGYRPLILNEAKCNEMRSRLSVFSVRPGISGYAQVYGKYNTTPYDKLKLDLTYIQNYSLFLDIKLILLTFKIFFQKETSEGIEDWQTTAATKENLETIKK